MNKEKRKQAGESDWNEELESILTLEHKNLFITSDHKPTERVKKSLRLFAQILFSFTKICNFDANYFLIKHGKPVSYMLFSTTRSLFS